MVALGQKGASGVALGGGGPTFGFTLFCSVSQLRFWKKEYRNEEDK